MATLTPIDDLPDELLHQIFSYLSPHETLTSISLVSRQFFRLSQTPLLWRQHCIASFHHWAPEHAFPLKLRAKIARVNWRGLFLIRARRNRRIARKLEAVIATRVHRIRHLEQICLYGYDAKDFLLEQCRIPADGNVEDVLARRHWAGTALGSIHRGMALDEWAKFAQHLSEGKAKGSAAGRLNCGMRLERALGAFDMFVLHHDEGDLDDISAVLDNLAIRFRDALKTPPFAPAQSDAEVRYGAEKKMSSRQMALSLAYWLRMENLTGLDDESTYRYLRNCLIGRALSDEGHPSLPIISAAIYCALAERVGLTAYPCLLPSHVHVIVQAPQAPVDMSLDGQTLSSDSIEQEPMFLDPYHSYEEIPRESIGLFLRHLGAASATAHTMVPIDRLLVPTSTDHVVMRTAQNIRFSFSTFRTTDQPYDAVMPMIELRPGDFTRNFDPALYSMIWASLMMAANMLSSLHLPAHSSLSSSSSSYSSSSSSSSSSSLSHPPPPAQDPALDLSFAEWQQDVRDLLRYSNEHFPEDVWLLEKHLLSLHTKLAATASHRMHHNPTDQNRANVRRWHAATALIKDHVRAIRRQDGELPYPRLRSNVLTTSPPLFRVGQVFRHKRYGHYGVVCGWIFDKSAAYAEYSGLWPDPTGSQEHLTERPYYRCLVNTQLDHHVVAEASMEHVDFSSSNSNGELPSDIRGILPTAGEYFKRWDAHKGEFVSNMKWLHPED